MKTRVLSATIALLVFASSAGAQFGSSSYSAAITFASPPLSCTTMKLAYDGSKYWHNSGGCQGRDLARHGAGGALEATYNVPLDFRSLFSDAGGTLYASTYASNNIYRMTAPGVFANHVTLAGPVDWHQSGAVLNGAGNEYIALSPGGEVRRWNLSGASLGSTFLAGFGGAENNYPQNVTIAAVGGYYLTINGGTGTGNEVLSMWNAAGARLGTTTLLGSGESFDTNFSLSYANGMAFLNDQNGGNWRGYDVGLGGGGPGVVPEPGSIVLVASGLIGVLGFARRRQKQS